ncbi:MAG: FtsX-like permease family protein [Byssovorax sp.]
MPFSWFVALRYLREGRMQTALILGAVAIGVTVLTFLSALIGGLQESLIAKTLGSQAHIVLRPPDASARVVAPTGSAEVPIVRADKPSQHVQTLEQWQPLAAEVLRAEGVVAVAAEVTGSAFVTRGAATRAVALRGIDPEPFDRIIPVARKLTAGRYPIAGSDALIGVELARDLGFSLGDKLRVTSADGRAALFTIAGVFDFGQKDANQRWVMVPLRAAQTLLDLPGAVTALSIKVADVFTAESIAAGIQGRTGLVAESWMTNNQQLLTGLRSQSSSKNVILFFVTVTVALGIASVLIVSVVQKSREIGVLRAVGTQSSRVLYIFLIQGGLLGFAGSIVGSGLGALLAALFTSLQKNPDGTPMFPAVVDAPLVIEAVALATAVGILAAIAPARRAAALEPAQVIRYG